MPKRKSISMERRWHIDELARPTTRIRRFANNRLDYRDRPKQSDRYSYPVFHGELTRDIRYRLFANMTDREWAEALERGNISVSASGTFVSVRIAA